MFKNYLKIAFRNLFKYKIYSFINIFGLAIGIACCVVILLYVQDELSYDTFHEKADRTYRVLRKSDVSPSPQIPATVAPVLLAEYPEVLDAVRVFHHWYTPLISYKESGFYEERFLFADNSVFDIFTYHFIKGDPKTALAEPFSLVITESTAKKYFGNEDPIGKTLVYNVEHQFRITGVLYDVPHNTHLKFDFLASLESLPDIMWPTVITSWGMGAFHTYVVLPEAYSPNTLSQKFPSFVEKYRKGKPDEYSLQYVPDIHLYSHLRGELEPNSDIKYVYILSTIAFLILLVASINYMNLATARSIHRAKEVGLRKVIGADRKALIHQFLEESVLMAVLASCFAVSIIELLLPVFHSATGKELMTDYSNNWILSFGIIGITLFVSIFAGSYPAFYLSAFQPIKVMKESLNVGLTRSHFRKILVIVQFTVSMILIVGVLIVFNQLNYMKNKKLGFNKEQIIVIPVRDKSVHPKYDVIKKELLQNPDILGVAASSSMPGQRTASVSFKWEGKRDDESVAMAMYWINHDFMETFECEIIAGRGFSKEFTSDEEEAVIINETAVKEIGWASPEEAVGKKMIYWGGTPRIIGIVKDFHFYSLHKRIEPLIIDLQVPDTGFLSVKINTDKISETLSFLKNKWQQFSSEQPFTYSFLDKDLDMLYKSEEQWGDVIGYASFLAIFIACLGLFGLASFTAEQRTKEIGVRKVLGASVSNIVFLLSKDFIKLIIFALTVASPIAYFAMNRWLQGFAYRIEVSFAPFLIANMIVLVIALFTVSYQSIKAALANPVDALRYE